MKPGRELDALIAEKVMGLDKELLNQWERYRNSGSYSVATFDELPSYSTNISAAWEVVEKSEQQEFEYRLFGPYEHRINGDFISTQCEFINSTTRAWYSSEGETVPHAICLAALKAVGVEI